jgi:hypothetical protein
LHARRAGPRSRFVSLQYPPSPPCNESEAGAAGPTMSKTPTPWHVRPATDLLAPHRVMPRRFLTCHDSPSFGRRRRLGASAEGGLATSGAPLEQWACDLPAVLFDHSPFWHARWSAAWCRAGRVDPRPGCLFEDLISSWQGKTMVKWESMAE